MLPSQTSSIQQQTFPVVVPAAGIGSRMNADRPKQYLPLLNRTVIEHTLLRLNSHPNIEHIILVLHPEDEYFQTLEISNAPWLKIVEGGKERSDSVLNGVLEVKESEWVLVHDAARPCVRLDDITRLINAKSAGIGAILAKPVSDTMKKAKAHDLIEKSEPREKLWHALTPQFFPTIQLLDALKHCAQQHLPITDEASAIELTGGEVKLVAGAGDNIKITVQEDLALAEFLLSRQEVNND